MLKPFIGTVPVSVLAPMLANTLPRAVLGPDAWGELVEAIRAGEEAGWKPVLDVIAGVLESKQDPESYAELIASIRA